MKKLLKNTSFSVMALTSYAMQQIGASAWVVGLTGSATLGVIAPIAGLGLAGIAAGYLAEKGVVRIHGPQHDFIYDDEEYHAVTHNKRITLLGLMVGTSALLLMSPWAALACGFSTICAERVIQGKSRMLLNLAMLGSPVAPLLGISGWLLRAGILMGKLPTAVTSAMTARNIAVATGIVAEVPMIWNACVHWGTPTTIGNEVLPPPDTRRPLPPPNTWFQPSPPNTRPWEGS